MRPGLAALALGAVLLAPGLAGCARRVPPPAAPAYPYKADAPKVFYATSSGLSEVTFEGEADDQMPASKAPNASVLSSDGRSIAVAVNGWGIERIEPSPDGRAYRIVDSPDQQGFAGLSTGGIWPMGGGFLVHLYRDPFADADEPAGAAAQGAAAQGAAAPSSISRLAFFGPGQSAATRPDPLPTSPGPGPLAGYEPFVLLPAAGTWFAELRKDAADRVDMKFFSIDDPLAATQAAREIRRSEFEKALEPLPLSGLAGDAGASLRSSLGALGAGPWLVRLRSGTGEDRWYLSSGRAEDATNAYAWNLSGGTPTILALAPDGRLAIADGRGAPTLISIPAPQEGATFTALAAIDGIAAAAWECGSFPYISSAGLVLHSLR